jgi:hypothetical protein
LFRRFRPPLLHVQTSDLYFHIPQNGVGTDYVSTRVCQVDLHHNYFKTCNISRAVLEAGTRQNEAGTRFRFEIRRIRQGTKMSLKWTR